MTFRVLIADDLGIKRREPRMFPGLDSEFAVIGESTNVAVRGAS